MNNNKKLGGTKWRLNRAIQNELNNLTILRTSSNISNNATNSNSNLANNNDVVVNHITQSVNLELDNLNQTVQLPCEPTGLNTNHMIILLIQIQ